MSSKTFSILSTRPLDESLIEVAANSRVEIDQLTFIEIKPAIEADTKAAIDALAAQKATVVFTSMNAVEVLVAALPDKANMPQWTIYCMGGATFALVKKYWPYNAISGTAKNASELAAIILADKQTEVYFFCGNKRREELPHLLMEQQVVVNELMIYETIETATTLDKQYDGILFFSPSAVHSFFQKNTVNEETVLFAIGETSGKAIQQFSTNKLVVGDFPAKDQLVHKAITYFNEEA